VFFHGEPWIADVAAARNHMAAVSVLAGNGSGVYTKLFEDPQRFPRLLKKRKPKPTLRFGRVILGGWSAGCGALRQILKSPESYARVNAVICIDGVHTDYAEGKPGPLESSLSDDNLRVWLQSGPRRHGRPQAFPADPFGDFPRAPTPAPPRPPTTCCGNSACRSAPC
jgi:pimeloyl-ACP methyl ester carboxylesterase